MKYFLIFLCGFAALVLQAQDPKEIINKHLKQSGGKANWNQLNSIVLKGETILGVGDSYKLVIYHRRPYFKRVAFVIEGKEVVNEGFDGKRAWTFSAEKQKNVQVKNYQLDSFENDLMNFDKKGMKAKYLGKDKELDCYIVQLIKNKGKTTYCFANNNYQLLWEENQEERLYFYEYQRINGLDFAKKIVGKPAQGGEYTIFFDEIYVNPAINPKKFKF